MSAGPVSARPASARPASAGPASAGSAATLAARSGSRARLGWAAPVLALGSVLLLLLFHAEAAAAVHVWSTSTAYGHCFLVLPVAAWLAWERRGALAGQAARPWPWALLALPPLAAVWFAAERLGIMEGRQLAAMAMLLMFVLAVLGRRLWWAFSVPLLYLFFLVPFGGFLVRPLQAFTAAFIDLGLDVLGIAHVVTRFVIEIPEGTFRVAEACAGLRFLIAAVAFGVVYGCVLYRSPGRRIAFMLASIVVPVVANGLRALGTVALGHLLGSAQAASVDHILYGWIFFSIVIVLLILAGLPFREDGQSQTAVPPTPPMLPAGRGRVAAVAAAALVLATAAPAVSAVLERRASAEQAGMPHGLAGGVLAGLVPPPGCRTTAPGRFDCGDVAIRASVAVFAPRVSPAALIAARRAATGELAAEDASGTIWTLRSGEPRQWQVMQTIGPDRLTATSLRVDGDANLSGLAMRLRQARSSVLGAATPPVLVAVSAQWGGGAAAEDAARAALRSFLERQDVRGIGAAPGLAAAHS